MTDKHTQRTSRLASSDQAAIDGALEEMAVAPPTAFNYSRKIPKGQAGGKVDQMLKAALAYADHLGWAVFPLKVKGKEPLTPHGCLDATTNTGTIRAWWGRWPEANVGIACGPSKLVVIDLDSDKGGEETWADLCREHSIDDDTVTSLTGAGGQHLVFINPDGADIHNSAGRLGAGVDVRAGGGYIVAPPSVHPNGREYVWDVGAHPADRNPAPLPAALLILLAEDKPKAAPPLPDTIPTGERNATLTSLAGSMRRRGASEGAILAALEQENAGRCDPPLAENELVSIAKSIARYPPNQHIQKLGEMQVPEPSAIHLTDIDGAGWYGHRVVAPITVVGTGETFAVPGKVAGVVCVARKDDMEECISCPMARRFDVEIPSDDPLVIAATAISTYRLEKLLAVELWRKARGGDLGKRPLCESGRLAWLEIEARPLTELRVYPLAAELVLKNGETVDETGREYRKKDIFYLGAKAHNVQRFAATGTVLANPKTQVVTLLADKLEPVEADLSFDPAQGRQWPLDRLDDLLDAWSRQVTKVYGRNDALLALLLAYASPLYFIFEAEQEKGWLEVAFIGDSTTGKGQTALRTRAALGCGSYALGECASRAGLLYGIEAGTRGHILIWGELPQADGRLLIVDGANVISKEEWTQTREVRRQGFVSVRRIVSGEHPCRVRFVAIGNPGNPVKHYKYPCEAVKDLFDPADIARFDVAVIFDEADVPIEAINEAPTEEEEVDLSWVRHNVLRAWHIRPNEINFAPEALEIIYSRATQMARRYQGANDIPLVTNDIKKKLARLSLSLALLLGETTVSAKHVAYIAYWLDRLYRRMRLDAYAGEQQKKARGGSEKEINETREWLEEQMAASDCMKMLVNDIFAQEHRIRLKDIVARLNHIGSWDPRTIQRHLSKLRGADLVISGSSGYVRKQKMVTVLREIGGHTLEDDKDDENDTAEVDNHVTFDTSVTKNTMPSNFSDDDGLVRAAEDLGGKVVKVETHDGIVEMSF